MRLVLPCLLYTAMFTSASFAAVFAWRGDWMYASACLLGALAVSWALSLAGDDLLDLST